MRELCILVHRYPPASTAEAVRIGSLVRCLSGVEELHVHCCGTAQQQAGEQIRILGPARNFSGRSLLRAIQEIGLGWTFLRSLRAKRPSIFLISSPPYLSFLMVRTYLALIGKPFVHDLRDPYPFLLGPFGSCFAMWERWLSGRTEWISVTNEQLAHELQARFRCPVHYIPNGFDAQEGQASINGQPLKLAVLGNIGSHQANHTLIDLIQHGRELPIEWHVIGSGSMETQLRIKVRNERVVFHGRLGVEQARSVLRSCQLGINLRSERAWNRWISPVRTYEYLGAGLPQLMAPGIPFFKSMEAQGAGWCLETLDVPEMVNLLRRLLSDPSIWQMQHDQLSPLRESSTRSASNARWAKLLFDRS